MEKEQIKKWLKNPLNLALLGVLVFAFAIRLYYFSFTLGQGLWWDEAAYGSLAKNIMHGGVWNATDLIIGEKGIRPPLFPLIWGFLGSIGFGESAVRFLLEFIPSVITVFFVYLIGKEIYGEKEGVVSALIFSVLWIHLFYTGRLLTNVPALSLLFPSIFYFILSMKNDFSWKYFSIALALGSLSTLIRYPNGLIFVVYLAFMILTFRTDLLKNKKFWISGIFGLLPLGIFFLINYINFENIFPALLGGNYVKVVSKSIGYYVLNFIPSYLTQIFFITFILGILIALSELFFGYDMIKRNNKLKGHLVILLLFLVIYSFFIFYLRGAEDRWLFPASLSLILFSGYGLIKIQEFLKKYSKNISFIVIILLLSFGIYSQISFANNLIESRSSSFLQLRSGFEWIKENTAEGSMILGSGIEAYSIYYAERDYLRFTANESDMVKLTRKADYIVLHAFTKPPDYVNKYMQDNLSKWKIIKVFFFDENQKQPAFIVYKKV